MPFHFFGLRESPFHVSPDLRYYMTTGAAQAAFTELCYGIQMRKGLMVLTGEPGTGKTTLLHRLLRWLRENNKSSSYVFHCHLETEDLLKSIFQGFGIVRPGQSKSDLLGALATWLDQRTAAGDSPVAIVDEAQGLSIRALDELRLLLNMETPNGKLLQIVLAGQPELDEKLRRPQLLQLRQRISVRGKLPLFSLEQCADYIGIRLAVAGKKEQDTFPAETIRAIHACSGGIPRVMNLLCENALLSAYAEGEASVSVEMVRCIAADFDLETANLPGKFSSTPIHPEIPARKVLDRAAEPRHRPETIPFPLAETSPLNTPQTAVNRAAAMATVNAAHRVALIEQLKTKIELAQIELRKTRPVFLVKARDYCRRLLRSFLQDWDRVLQRASYTSGRHTHRHESYARHLTSPAYVRFRYKNRAAPPVRPGTSRAL